MKKFETKVVGLYRPAGTSYAIYEIKDKDGSFAGGAFSKEEFIAEYRTFYPKKKIISIKKLPAEDIGDGWKKSKA